MPRRVVGYVYFILANTPDGLLVKIGYSNEDPYRRWRTLSTGSPIPLLRWGYFRGRRHDEYALHQRFREQRSHGEWFFVDDELAEYLETVYTQWPAEPPMSQYEADVLMWAGWLFRMDLPVSLDSAMRLVDDPDCIKTPESKRVNYRPDAEIPDPRLEEWRLGGYLPTLNPDPK